MSARVHRIRVLLEYETWAFTRVYESLETLDESGGVGGDAAFVKACSLAWHIELARTAWLWRLTSHAEPLVDRPDEIFHDEPKLADTLAAHELNAEPWARYASALDDAELDRVCEYQSMSGTPYQTRVEDILTHVAHHGMYHRGQIAPLVRRTGGQPAATDYILFARDRLAHDTA